MTESRLRNIALWYCQRYLVSSGKLADHLEKRVRRDMPDGAERDAVRATIPAIVADMERLNLVNDREAVSARLRSALRSGYAADAAVFRASRGAMVDRNVAEKELEVAVTEVLPGVDPEDIGSTEAATEQACAALKRARRGPWRSVPQDERSRRRDAGWLQRRGFRMDAIRAALDIDPLED